jgi:hypothetical protein
MIDHMTQYRLKKGQPAKASEFPCRIAAFHMVAEQPNRTSIFDRMVSVEMGRQVKAVWQQFGTLFERHRYYF